MGCGGDPEPPRTLAEVEGRVTELAKQAKAAMVAARAREIRDRKEETPRLFTDKAFLRKVVLRFILEEAKKSEAARKLNSMIEAARGLAERVIRGLRSRHGEEEAEEAG